MTFGGLLTPGVGEGITISKDISYARVVALTAAVTLWSNRGPTDHTGVLGTAVIFEKYLTGDSK